MAENDDFEVFDFEPVDSDCALCLFEKKWLDGLSSKVCFGL